MKALSLSQPWASLVMMGEKKFETRSWTTNYRGLLAIHASRDFDKSNRALLANEWFYYDILGDDPSKLPLGMVIATCQLTAIVPAGAAKFAYNLGEQEMAFGNYTYGRWAWKLDDVQPLEVYVPAKGHLGLWEWNGL